MTIEKQIQKIKWYHSIQIGNMVTPGSVPRDFLTWQTQAIPRDLTGKTVLDIGAWDGFFSFHCERAGARRVLAIDNSSGVYSWGMKSNTGFQLAKKQLRSNVEFKQLSVYDLATLEESFDVVVFFGVYYHLSDPLRAFEAISQKTRELLIIEGHVIDDTRPVMYLYDPFELNPQDPSNYWGPSVPCLEKMLKRVGFKRVSLISRREDRALLQAWKS